MGQDFRRPSSPDSFLYRFGGLKTNAPANTLSPDKYPLAVNIRAYGDANIRTRPGLVSISAGGAKYLDLRAYTALMTDDLPRILAYATGGRVWIDTGTQVGTLVDGGSPLATLIPFRPGASPSPWMYIANGFDYQKFSAPTSSTGASGVVAEKVGIAEPQQAVDAVIDSLNFSLMGGSLTNGGTAGAASSAGLRTSDSCGAVFLNNYFDAPLPTKSWSVQVSSSVQYQRFQDVIINSSAQFIVQDVFAPLPTALSIESIFYFAGTTGHCIIVPGNLASTGDQKSSLYSADVLASLRRGALIQIGSEIVMIWSATSGPNGTICIETSTAGPHTTADTIVALPAIQILGPSGVAAPVTGQTIQDGQWSYSVATGIGWQTATLAFNPFVGSGISFQPDDYISYGILVDTPENLTEFHILIDVGDGSFAENYYYYVARPSDIAGFLADAETQLAAVQQIVQNAEIDALNPQAANNQLQSATSAQTAPGNSQWTQLLFPLSEFTRVGSDDTKTLQNANSIRFWWNCSGTINVKTDQLAKLFGGSQPDVGDIGAPYRYRIRGRSSTTGACGNPSPEPRAGVNPRRAAVNVFLPGTLGSEMDTWDIFRWGGSVTSWRFIGSQTASNVPSVFEDVFDDSAAQAGDALDFDNFEPWPSIDVPNTGSTVSVCGTTAIVTSTDPDIVSYLPGTLVQLGGQNAYTLWTRPLPISGSNYLLQFIENAGAAGAISYVIQEPVIARRFLASMWGPDANGTVFAVGDSLRPGSVYYAKNYAPDSAPDSYNSEITPPSEPLVGGLVVDGLSWVASTERWFAMYPQPDNPAARYNIVQGTQTRGLLCAHGCCTDGQSIFWWAKDGIYSSTQGSLTDADLSNLFPRDGIPAEDYTYFGTTIPHPDYAQASKFRLAYSNGFLYATYCGLSGLYYMLVCDLRFGKPRWSYDSYPFQITVPYHVEQQAESSSTLNPVLLMGGFPGGTIYRQQDLTNDGGNTSGTPIGAQLATFEFDGEDIRAQKQWGDLFVDLIPVCAGTVQGVQLQLQSAGSAVGGIYFIAKSTSRQRTPVDLGSVIVSDFLGLVMVWTDDYSKQSIPTRLYAWQPSWVIQPAAGLGWRTLGSAFGLSGFMHLRQALVAWKSTAPITFQATSFDGQSPVAIAIPSSGGAYKKAYFPFSANKGLLWSFSATSSAPFQLFLDDCEIAIGQWSRQGSYETIRHLSGSVVDAGVV